MKFDLQDDELDIIYRQWCNRLMSNIVYEENSELELCLNGCKKIENDERLSKILREVYKGHTM